MFIKENGHLLDFAPASETSKGVKLGDFNQTLLQKIEELTLYMIKLKKENEQLISKINSLKYNRYAKSRFYKIRNIAFVLLHA